MSKIQEVKRKLNAAINDAKRDGIILVYGGAYRYTDSCTGVTKCCLIGAALGDLSLKEVEKYGCCYLRIFSERYGITWEQTSSIEDGFEDLVDSTEPNEWEKLGESFRRQAR